MKTASALVAMCQLKRLQPQKEKEKVCEAPVPIVSAYLLISGLTSGGGRHAQRETAAFHPVVNLALPAAWHSLHPATNDVQESLNLAVVGDVSTTYRDRNRL
jgi:hypothetical protein